MANKNYITLLFLLILGTAQLTAQEKYKISPYPDLWYNSVDGLRFGIRLQGEMEGSFKDGPHRLDLGLWGGSNFPELPISYYFSLIEPIASLSEFQQEGNYQVISSVRAGFARHRIQLNKRFQNGFDELDSFKISLFFSYEKMFDTGYAIFPMLWSSNQSIYNKWKPLVGFELHRSTRTPVARMSAQLKFEHNLNGDIGRYSTGRLILKQKIQTNDVITIRLRQFGGINFGDYVPENGFLFSMPSAGQFVNNGFSRAPGTVPEAWFERGLFQFQGGANLRGYATQEIDLLAAVQAANSLAEIPLSEKIIAVNMDIEFSNPINSWLNNITIIGDLMELRSYVFFDAGKGFGSTVIQPKIFALPQDSQTQDVVPDQEFGEFDEEELLMDSGLGLQISFNIPDYLGADRGFFIRYELPLWLSSPAAGDPNFKYRTLIGLGAIFSF